MALPIGDRGGEQPVRIPTDDAVLDGDLALAAAARGVVVFAHGRGSSRFSPRNRHVAGRLQRGGLATLLIDLLTPEEEARRRAHARSCASTSTCSPAAWSARPTGCRPAARAARSAGRLLRRQHRRGRRAGGRGRAAGRVGAVVSRGGRPDLAGDALPRVRAPTLLIVGGHDLP